MLAIPWIIAIKTQISHDQVVDDDEEEKEQNKEIVIISPNYFPIGRMGSIMYTLSFDSMQQLEQLS